jgi:hypothetical protein
MKKLSMSLFVIFSMVVTAAAQNRWTPICYRDTIAEDSLFAVLRTDESGCNHYIWSDSLFLKGKPAAVTDVRNSVMNNWYTVKSFAAWLPVPGQANKYIVVEKSLTYFSIFDSTLNTSGIIVIRVGVGIFLLESDKADTLRPLSYQEFVSSDVGLEVSAALPGELLDGALVRVSCISGLGKVAYFHMIYQRDLDFATALIKKSPNQIKPRAILQSRAVNPLGRKIAGGYVGLKLVFLPNGGMAKIVSFSGKR